MNRSLATRRRSIVEGLTRLVPTDALITSETGCKAYGSDGFRVASNTPLAVVLPETTEQVQEVVRYLHETGTAVVPRGAGTNLTGATVPIGECVTISTNRLRRILDFDPVSGTIRVEAGVRNVAISNHVRDSGWFYAPDPSSRRSCTVGGNIATNSGGASCLRYGVTVNSLSALAVILSDGERVELGGEGYEAEDLDLAALVCGSEGQIGIVTEAVLRLVPVPRVTWSMMLAFDDASDSLTTAAAILAAGILPRQLDFLDHTAIRVCEAFFQSGYPRSAKALLLIQLDGLVEELDAQRIRIADLAKRPAHLVTLRDPTLAKTLWRGRETIYGAARRESPYVMLDCAVPLSQLPNVLEVVKRHTSAHGLEAAVALHASDGTLHAFIFHQAERPSSTRAAEACANAIRSACAEVGGTISSEYGVGLQKRSAMAAQFTPEDLAVQQRCITALQRGGALNPGKVFPCQSMSLE